MKVSISSLVVVWQPPKKKKKTRPALPPKLSFFPTTNQRRTVHVQLVSTEGNTRGETRLNFYVPLRFFPPVGFLVDFDFVE